MKLLIRITIIIWVVFGTAGIGLAEDSLDGETVAAVQDRVFFRHHEIDLGIGYIPDDDFYELFPAELGYTYNFNDHFAWNVINLHWMFDQDKDLKEKLEEEFGVTPENFDKTVYALHSNLIFKPLYGKSVFRNSRVINHETYFGAGGGFVAYETETSDGETETQMMSSISLGIGQKIFIGQNLCVNLELKDWINFKEDQIENNFWFGISMGFRFNLSARKSEQDQGIKKASQYLE
jgi:outer membrane beta-barrel protein